MSLNTIIEIGSKFKSSPDGIKYHEFIYPCPQDKDKQRILRLNLPVKITDAEIEFDLGSDKFGVIYNEDLIGNNSSNTKLFYLRYKTSKNDSSKPKYLFGDIYYTIDSSKEKGNYFVGADSLRLGKTLIGKIEKMESESSQQLIRFFKFLENNKTLLHKILQYNEGIFHFLNLKPEERDSELDLPRLVKSKEQLRLFTARSCLSRIDTPKKIKDFFKDKLHAWSDLANNQEEIDRLLKTTSGSIFLHFDINGKSWYEDANQMKIIWDLFNQDFSDDAKVKFKKDGVQRELQTFKTILFRGLCSGNDKNDKQFPGLISSNKHKSKAFSKDDMESLFFGTKFLDTGLFLGKGSDIRMVVLPGGKKLKAGDYEQFFQKIGSREGDETNEDKLEQTEKVLERKNSDAFLDFMDLPDDFEEHILRYDVILAIKGQNTTSDMVEIQGIQRSFLRQVYARIREKKNTVYEKIAITREKSTYGVGIYVSLNRILGKVRVEETKDESDKKLKVKVPKYEGGSILTNHLLKILPKIFTSTYFNDDRLLPATIERIELFIRQGMLSSKQSWHVEMLVFDLEFLFIIQNTSIDNQNFLQIMASKSYELGKNLGRFALFFKPVDPKYDYTPIRSFEQEYVGNLRRHIGQLADMRKFADMLFEKYHLHKHRKKEERIPWDIRNGEVVERITRLGAEIEESSYDKNECAFGFFESYFERFKEKTLPEKLQALLEKNENDETHAELIQSVQQVLIQYNQN